MPTPPPATPGNTAQAATSAVAVVGFALTIWVAGLVHVYHLDPLRPPEQSLRTGRMVDINRADAGTLSLLPGVGPTLGDRIVSYRASRGGFDHVEQLDEVPRVGPSIMKRITPWVVCSSKLDTPIPMQTKPIPQDDGYPE